ncbi:transmembrane proteins 14C-domain-containing protein [Nemania serpens]|nr:transmembrane proteins 14C-domain-containing protein [Nemania serpens]
MKLWRVSQSFSHISPDLGPSGPSPSPSLVGVIGGAPHPFGACDPHTKMSLENIAYVLGALTAGGGTFGYVRTGSVPSIAAGVTVGLLYGLGGYRIQTRQSYGIELALLASIVLGGSSIPRAIRLGKPVPTVLSLISVFGLYTFGNAFRKTL